ncbi:MAG: glycosyltransferase family 4 protein [Armatimonadia bacterium]
MRLTVISHSCVLPANQKLWAKVAAHEGIELRLVAPRRWRSSLHGQLDFEPLPELADAARPLGVHLSGNLHLHTYSDLGPALTDGLPDVLYLDEDPHSLVAWQVLDLQRLMEFQIVITLKQNILKRYPPPFAWIERASYRRAAAAAATSQQCLQVAQRKGYRGPAEIVHYPIDVELFTPRARPAPGGSFRVGYAGRLVAEKGIQDLVEAVALLQRDAPATLSIVGAGPLGDQLPTILPPASLQLMGTLSPEQMPDWYRSLDVLVLPSHTTPSWQEQFGRAAAEAMACGIPVVGSDSGFIPELIESAGGGLVYPEGDVAALAAALGRLSQDPALRVELGERGRDGVVALYSEDVVAAKVLALLERVQASSAPNW